MPRDPFAEFLGFTHHYLADGSCEVQFQPLPEHFNPHGTLHGGVLSALADSAMGMTWLHNVAKGKSFTTLELKINFLKPVWHAPLRAVGRILKAGRTIGLVICDIYDENGSLVAHASSTIMMLSGEAAKGR